MAFTLLLRLFRPDLSAQRHKQCAAWHTCSLLSIAGAGYGLMYRCSAGSTPAYADFCIFSLLDIGMKLVPRMLTDHPVMRAWFTRVREIPEVANYMAQRPVCRDVSRWAI
jgi:hypothetical protein